VPLINHSGTFFLSLQKIYIMKIKLLMSMNVDGKDLPAGEIIEINKANKDKWISKGWGELVQKESKVKKETKELKVSKETKDATN